MPRDYSRPVTVQSEVESRYEFAKMLGSLAALIALGVLVGVAVYFLTAAAFV